MAKYCRSRQREPKTLEKGTFRTTPIKKGVLKITACPKGARYRRGKGRGCYTKTGKRVSTKLATVLYAAGTRQCPRPGVELPKKAIKDRIKNPNLPYGSIYGASGSPAGAQIGVNPIYDPRSRGRKMGGVVKGTFYEAVFHDKHNDQDYSLGFTKSKAAFKKALKDEGWGDEIKNVYFRKMPRMSNPNLPFGSVYGASGSPAGAQVGVNPKYRWSKLTPLKKKSGMVRIDQKGNKWVLSSYVEGKWSVVTTGPSQAYLINALERAGYTLGRER